MFLLVVGTGLALDRPVYLFAGIAGSPLFLMHALSLRDVPRMLEVLPDGLRARTFSGRNVVLGWADVTEATYLDGSGWWRGVRQLRLRAPGATLLMVGPVPGFDAVRSEALRRLGAREEREFTGWRSRLRWWWLPTWDQSSRFKRFEEEGPSWREGGEIDAPGSEEARGEEGSSAPSGGGASEWTERRWKKGVLMAFMVLLFCVGGPVVALDGRLSSIPTVFLLTAATWALASTVVTFRECISTIRAKEEHFEAITYGGQRVHVPWQAIQCVERWPRGGRRIVSAGAKPVYLPAILDGDETSHAAIVEAIDRHVPASAEVWVSRRGLSRVLRF